MNKINRLKYTGVIAGVGLAVVLFSSGAYANTSSKDTEKEIVVEEELEVISLDFGQGHSEEPYEGGQTDIVPADTDSVQESEEEAASSEADAVLSAGGGDVLEDIEQATQDAVALPSVENPSEPAEGSTEPEQPAASDDMGLSAGAGTVLDQAQEDPVESAAREEQADGADQAGTAEPQADVQEMAEPEKHWGYTNLGIAHVDNHLNIREEPNESGKLIGKLSKDAACEILDIDENGWAHIKSGKVNGYCSTEYLYLGDAAIARGHEVASMIAIVNTQTLKVRGEPNTDSIVITLIPQEEELEVVEIMENGWIKFLLDDEEAYVSGEYVDVEERLEKAVTLTELKYGQGVSDVRVDMVQYAKQFVGNPYVWGGTSLTNGTDCSGFTMGIYSKYGVSLPHHAASQAQMGTKVDISSAQPGDLVFYAKNGSINHVAMYIGNGQVIHASSPKTGIKISSWNYRTPACIRRYLSN